MTKFKASFVHLLISALFVALFFLFVYFVWYQQIYFEISGVFTPMKILFVVDVVLGPLLTFIVYKEGKKHMKLDFILIALFQLLAFSYGAYSVFLGKPSLVIHRTGYMEVMLEKHVDYALLNDEMKSQNYLVMITLSS